MPNKHSQLSRCVGRIFKSLDLVWNGHILNPLWNDRLARRKKRYDATAGSTLRYLKRYAPEVAAIAPSDAIVAPEPEHAFSIWFQGEENAPELVKACFRGMREHLQLPLVVLDAETVFDWIELPDFVVEKWKKGKIPHAHFSDICRIELLYQHGGVWLDATDYVMAPIPDYIMAEDFFVFTSGTRIRGNYSGIQNCFIRGKKGNQLLDIWRKAIYIYWRNENSKINYFIHHLLLKLAVGYNAAARRLFDAMPKVEQDPTHALWDAHCADAYDEAEFRRLTKDAFFQKTNFKDKRLASAGPDTIAAHVLNSNL